MSRCGRLPSAVRQLAGLDGRHVGQRLAVLALLPIAAVAVLRLLVRNPQVPSVRQPAVGGGAAGGAAAGDPRLAAAFAVLDLLLLVARRGGGATPATTLLLTLSAAVLLACVGLLAVPGLIDRAATARMSTWAARAAGVVAAGLTVATLVAVAGDERGWASSATLPGYGAITGAALLGQMVLLVLLCGLVLWRHGHVRRRSALPRGLGATVIAAIAVGLSGAFSADLVYQTGVLLGGYRADDEPPLLYRWTILAVFLHLVAVLVCTALTPCPGVAGGMRRRTSPPATSPRRRRRRPDGCGKVTRAVARARFTEWLGPGPPGYAVLAVVGLAAGLLGQFGRATGRGGVAGLRAADRVRRDGAHRGHLRHRRSGPRPVVGWCVRLPDGMVPPARRDPVGPGHLPAGLPTCSRPRVTPTARCRSWPTASPNWPSGTPGWCCAGTATARRCWPSRCCGCRRAC